MACSLGAAAATDVRAGEICAGGIRKTREDLNALDLHLLEVRSGVYIETVCVHHEKQFLNWHCLNENTCCDPFGKHSVAVRKQLSEVTELTYRKCIASGITGCIMGKLLCISCKKDIFSRIVNVAPACDPLPSPVAPPPSIKSPPVAAAKVNQETSGDIEVTLRAEDGSAAGPSRSAYEKSAASASPKVNTGSSESQSASPLSTSSSDPGGSSSSAVSPRKAVIESMNKSMIPLGVSPLQAKKVDRSKSYLARKERQAKTMLQKSFSKMKGVKTLEEGDQEECSVDYEKAGREIIDSLKKKFDAETSQSRKIQILSVLPSSWSNQEIMRVFGATRPMVEKMRDCFKKQGVLCTPNKKPGKSLPQETRSKIECFYREPDISREMPGAKEYVSVKEGNQRIHKQKRLVLANLKEVYASFQERFPTDKVGFSKFAELRPKECVLAGAAGTHAVCVCLIHENFKLMFEGGKLNQITAQDGSKLFQDYKECLKKVVCDNPNKSCYFGKCSACPKLDWLRATLEQFYSDNFMEQILYSQWTTVDRCSLENVSKDIQDFIDSFIQSIPNVLKHDFTTKAQSEFYRKTRDNLQPGEVLVVADFSENYSFVLQNSTQGVHWNNRQSTIHPFACYYKPEGSNEPQPLNNIIISDHLEHSTAAVFAFQHSLVQFLRGKVPNLNKIIYFSDGAASQYKNRYNMINLVYHKQDFNVSAEWHFFGTSHGKGPSDGLGGMLKRLAARASLQLPADKQIQAPEELFNWAQSNIKGVTIEFVSSQTVNSIKRKINKRFNDCPAVHGIRTCHAAIPHQRSGQITMRTLSAFSEGFDVVMQHSAPSTSKDVTSLAVSVPSNEGTAQQLTPQPRPPGHIDEETILGPRRSKRLRK